MFILLILFNLSMLLQGILGYFVPVVKKQPELTTVGGYIFIFILWKIFKKFNFKKLFKVNIKREVFFWGTFYVVAELLFITSIIHFSKGNNLHRSALDNFGNTSLALTVAAILMPICEEVFFRGLVSDVLLKRYSPFITIIIGGILFGSYHQIPGLLFIISGSSFYYAYIYLKTKSIWNSIIAHVINNSIVGLFQFFSSKSDDLSSIYNLGTWGSIALYSASFICLIVCFYNHYRIYINSKEIHHEVVISSNNSKGLFNSPAVRFICIILFIGYLIFNFIGG